LKSILVFLLLRLCLRHRFRLSQFSIKSSYACSW
jgi:hypothetical protein